LLIGAVIPDNSRPCDWRNRCQHRWPLNGSEALLYRRSTLMTTWRANWTLVRKRCIWRRRRHDRRLPRQLANGYYRRRNQRLRAASLVRVLISRWYHAERTRNGRRPKTGWEYPGARSDRRRESSKGTRRKSLRCRMCKRFGKSGRSRQSTIGRG